MINCNNRISGDKVRKLKLKKNFNNIAIHFHDMSMNNLVKKSLKLNDVNKKLLLDLICYLNVGLRSRYTNKCLISEEGVIKCLEKIFINESKRELEDYCEVIFSMCTHSHATFDSVTSFTNTAKDFIRSIGCNESIKKLEDIRETLEGVFNIYDKEHLDILIACANHDLQKADLSRINLSKANLNGVNLSCAKLFIGCNSKKIDVVIFNDMVPVVFESFLSRNDLIVPNFSGAILDEAKITLRLPRDINTDELKLLFNSRNNSPTLLSTINSIDDKYEDIKISLMNQLLNYFNNKDIYSIFGSIKDTLLNSTFKYYNDININNFIVNKLLKFIEVKGSIEAVIMKNVELNIFLNNINKFNIEDKKKYMIDNNGFFIQLIHQSISSIDENIKKLAYDLYGIYLEIDYISKIDKSLNKYFEKDPAINLIFIDKYINEGLIVQNEYINNFLYGQSIKNIEWSSLYWFKDLDCQPFSKLNLDELFKTFKIFNSNYQFNKNKVKLTKLLKLLNLDNYHESFIEALSKKSHSEKYVDIIHQSTLNKIFNEFLKPNEACSFVPKNARVIFLKVEHLNSIFIEYDITNDSSKNKAKLLLTLSGIFTKFSSSLFFGTEDNSPIALRYYAYALMKMSYELDKEIIPQEVYIGWEKSFLGIGDSEPCTVLLSYNILSICKGFKDFDAAYIIPLAWR